MCGSTEEFEGYTDDIFSRKTDSRGVYLVVIIFIVFDAVLIRHPQSKENGQNWLPNES